MGLTIDSSVFVDSIVPKSKDRHVNAKEVIKLASTVEISDREYLL